jgi:hypothetical protein
MNHEQPTGDRSGQRRQELRRVRLPGFISDDDVGLGDVVKRATSLVGIKPCGGCAERARRLNNWMVFSKRP